MECIHCHYEIRPLFRFCPICGIEIVSPEIVIPYDKDDYPDGFNPELYDLEEPH